MNNNIKCDKCHQKFKCVFYDSYGFNYCVDCSCVICFDGPSESFGCCDFCRIQQYKIISLYAINLNLSPDIENLIYQFL